MSVKNKKLTDFTLIDGTVRFVDETGGLVEVNVMKCQGGYGAQIKSHLIPWCENTICKHVMNDSPTIVTRDPQQAINDVLVGHFALHHSPTGKLHIVK